MLTTTHLQLLLNTQSKGFPCVPLVSSFRMVMSCEHDGTETLHPSLGLHLAIVASTQKGAMHFMLL